MDHKEKGIIQFSGKLSTGTDLTIDFDLLKFIAKNKYKSTKMERWREGFYQKGKIYQQDVFSWFF